MLMFRTLLAAAATLPSLPSSGSPSRRPRRPGFGSNLKPAGLIPRRGQEADSRKFPFASHGGRLQPAAGSEWPKREGALRKPGSCGVVFCQWGAQGRPGALWLPVEEALEVAQAEFKFGT
jgi:hypothetical protein